MCAREKFQTTRSDMILTSDSLGPSASPLIITFYTHLGWREEGEIGNMGGGEERERQRRRSGGEKEEVGGGTERGKRPSAVISPRTHTQLIVLDLLS